MEQGAGKRISDVMRFVPRHTVAVEGQGFGGSVEHQTDAHACSKHHGEPGKVRKLRRFIISPKPDVAELTAGNRDNVEHKDRAKEHEGPPQVIHHLGQCGGRESGKRPWEEQAPHHHCDDDECRWRDNPPVQRC